MSNPPTPSDLQVRKLFASRLKSARILAGFKTQKDFADAISVEHETYRRWERAETEPNIATLAKIASECDVSLDSLILGKPHRRVPKVANSG